MQPHKHDRYFPSVIIFVAAIFICLTALPTYSTEDDIVKFGALAPLTGTNAIQGADMAKGFKLAIKRINEGYKVPMKGGETVKVGPGLLGHPVMYEIEDTGGRPQSGVAAARKLILQEDVTAIIGTYSSGVTVPVGHFANKKK